MSEQHETGRRTGGSGSENESNRSNRNTSIFRPGEHNMTEAQIKEVTDQLRQDVIAHLWRHRWMKKVVFVTIIIFALWIFTLIASIMFLAWWIKVDSGASKYLLDISIGASIFKQKLSFSFTHRSCYCLGAHRRHAAAKGLAAL